MPKWLLRLFKSSVYLIFRDISYLASGRQPCQLRVEDSPEPLTRLAILHRHHRLHGSYTMDFDHLAQERSGRIFQVWIQNLLRNSPEELTGKLASRHCSGTPRTASRFSNGAFNVCYRLTFDNGDRVLVRFAALGRVVVRNEKVEDEGCGHRVRCAVY